MLWSLPGPLTQWDPSARRVIGCGCQNTLRVAAAMPRPAPTAAPPYGRSVGHRRWCRPRRSHFDALLLDDQRFLRLGACAGSAQALGSVVSRGPPAFGRWRCQLTLPLALWCSAGSPAKRGLPERPSFQQHGRPLPSASMSSNSRAASLACSRGALRCRGAHPSACSRREICGESDPKPLSLFGSGVIGAPRELCFVVLDCRFTGS